MCYLKKVSVKEKIYFRYLFLHFYTESVIYPKVVDDLSLCAFEYAFKKYLQKQFEIFEEIYWNISDIFKNFTLKNTLILLTIRLL